MQGITGVNIAAAALIAQFVLVVIVFVAALIVEAGAQGSELPWIIFAIALITVGSLLFSDQLAALWRPLFPSAQVTGLSLSTAMLVTFIANIVLAGILVSTTGGSVSSPFTPTFFLIPVLAIFLREPFGRVVGYSVASAFLFTLLTLSVERESPYGSRGNGGGRLLAYWFVNLASFSLATFIGLITRPR